MARPHRFARPAKPIWLLAIALAIAPGLIGASGLAATQAQAGRSMVTRVAPVAALQSVSQPRTAARLASVSTGRAKPTVRAASARPTVPSSLSRAGSSSATSARAATILNLHAVRSRSAMDEIRPASHAIRVVRRPTSTRAPARTLTVARALKSTSRAAPASKAAPILVRIGTTGGFGTGPTRLATRTVTLVSQGSAVAAPDSISVADLPPWTGKVNLYRSGVYSQQRTFSWCVGASVQMMLNITLGSHVHTFQAQSKIMRYARAHDLMGAGEPPGTDALGWANALNHFEATRTYHVGVWPTFKQAIRHAAKRIRLTGRPVGLLVMNGRHAWVMTGFSATADPALGRQFRMRSVMVMGPLWPIRNAAGYDPRPNTNFALPHLRGFFMQYFGVPWNGRFVTVEP
jgi:hypothetical protein